MLQPATPQKEGDGQANKPRRPAGKFTSEFAKRWTPDRSMRQRGNDRPHEIANL